MLALARSLVVILVALIAVPALALTQTITTAVQLLATTVLVMGGTGTPLAPSTPAENNSYMSTMLNGFFVPKGTLTAVETPEEFWPSTGNDDLMFDDSVAQGVDKLHLAINSVNYGAGDKAIVFGYSQSAVIIAREKQRLAANPMSAPPASQLEFVVVGSLSNPDGGIFTRLPGFVIPGLGVTFEPAMPNDQYLTTSYVREYEGLADLPDNPLNLLALGNALVGAAVLHPDYRSVDPADPANITLPSTDPNSVYILMPTPRLPILMALDGVVPEPILAGLDPVLRWGVDLGYDRTTPANVPTPFTLAPTFNPITAASELPKAIADGVDAAVSAANLPPVAPLRTNTSVQSKSGQPQPTSKQAATRPRPLHVIRDSLDFSPKKARSTIRLNGDGPLRRIVNVLTGQRPEPAEAQPAEQQQQQDAAA